MLYLTLFVNSVPNTEASTTFPSSEMFFSLFSSIFDTGLNLPFIYSLFSHEDKGRCLR